MLYLILWEIKPSQSMTLLQENYLTLETLAGDKYLMGNTLYEALIP